MDSGAWKGFARWGWVANGRSFHEGAVFRSHRELVRTMSYNVEGFQSRADECVRLANLSKDQMIQRELLTLRQVYLKAADKLRELSRCAPQEGPTR